jgi:flagellar protein FlbD
MRMPEVRMIRLTRLNQAPLMINSDLIEHVETTPDTVVSLTTGQKFIVLESADEILSRVVEFRRAIYERMCQYSAIIQAAPRPSSSEAA